MQEWSKELCCLLDYTTLYFNLPATSLGYQRSWWRKEILCHLESFGDVGAKCFWQTEGQMRILDDLHSNVCNTSFMKSFYISHNSCETSKFPSFWGWSSPGVLLVSHPRGFLGHKRAQSLEAASHRLMLACKCGSGGWKLMPSSLLGALKTKTSSGSRGMNWSIVKRDRAASPELHFHYKGSLAMAVITPKQGRAENRPDRELLQCRGIILM